MTRRRFAPFLGALLGSLICSLASAAPLPNDPDLAWNYDHSTDVGHFRLVRRVPLSVPGERCGEFVWEFEAVEVFKGQTRVGDTIQLWGSSNPAEYSPGDESLLFVRFYDGVGDSPCTRRLFSNYRQIHNWCCKVRRAPAGNFLVFYEMIDSETRGPDILIPTERVFSVLRQFRAHPPVVKK